MVVDWDKRKKFRTKDLQRVVGAIRDKTFMYEEKEAPEINWAKYDEAQINEIADVLDNIRDIVDLAYKRLPDDPYTGPGRPPTPTKDIVKVLLMQSYFGPSNRVTAGFLRLFREKLGLSKDFSYKTIERGYDPERTKKLLDEVFKITNEIGNSYENSVTFDGSGDPATSKINYETIRSKQRRGKDNMEASGKWPEKHDFQTTVIGAGVHTKVICGFSSTDDHHIGELSHLPMVLFQSSLNVPDMKIGLGDGLYAKRPVCELMDLYGYKFYSIPARNATMRPRGVKGWKNITLNLVKDPQNWLRTFHGRSISETVNSMMKRREPTPLRKRLGERRDTEEFLKGNIHNIRQCGYLVYLKPQYVNFKILAG